MFPKSFKALLTSLSHQKLHNIPSQTLVQPISASFASYSKSSTSSRHSKDNRTSKQNPRGDFQRKAPAQHEQRMSKSTPSSPMKYVSKYGANTPEKSKAKDIESDDEFKLKEDYVPFDEFTKQIFGRSKEEVLKEVTQPEKAVTLKLEEQKKRFRFDLPWTCEADIPERKEGNLESILSLDKMISLDIAVDLVKRYIKGLQEGDIADLEQFLERGLWSKINKKLEEIKEKDWKLIVYGNVNKETTSVDLMEVSNYFCVGVDAKRKKNGPEGTYTVFDSVFMGCPVVNMIKRRLEGDEMAVVRVILDLYVKTPVSLGLVDENGDIVAQESGKDMELRTHHVRLENDMMQVVYKTLKRKIEAGETVEKYNTGSFEYVFKKEGWRIIDVDGFMDGNEPLKP